MLVKILNILWLQFMCVNKNINLKRLHSKTLLEFRIRSVSKAEFVAHGLTDFVLSLVVLMIRGGRPVGVRRQGKIRQRLEGVNRKGKERRNKKKQGTGNGEGGGGC